MRSRAVPAIGFPTDTLTLSFFSGVEGRTICQDMRPSCFLLFLHANIHPRTVWRPAVQLAQVNMSHVLVKVVVVFAMQARLGPGMSGPSQLVCRCWRLQPCTSMGSAAFRWLWSGLPGLAGLHADPEFAAQPHQAEAEALRAEVRGVGQGAVARSAAQSAAPRVSALRQLLGLQQKNHWEAAVRTNALQV